MKVPILKIPFDARDAERICGELSSMLLEGRLAMGRHNAAFEAAFAEFCGVPHALGTSNGTTALEIISRALDLQGAAVALPANTFMATALAPIAAGAKAVLVDCDPVHFQICPDDLERKLTPAVKAVFVVHLGGFISPHFARIREIVERSGAVLIEDAAHAHGAEIELDGQMRRAGALGRAAAFSFYPTKVLTTAEGGMVTCADEALHRRMTAIRQHGQSRPGSNVHEGFGLNYRPSEIHALLGLAMMEKAGWILESRRRAAAVYDELLAGAPVAFTPAPPGQRPAYYKYMALLPEGVDRAALKKRLSEEYEISLAGEVYATPCHRQPLWAEHPEYLAAPVEDLPNSEMVARRQICLPLYPGLEREAQEYVVDSLLRCL